MATFGEKVRHVRWKRRMRAVELGKLANISASYLSNIENGRAINVSRSIQLKISDALQVPLSHLIDDAPEPQDTTEQIQRRVKNLNSIQREVLDKLLGVVETL